MDITKGFHNPDVLSCLANLSNDEVFTSPEIANRMLDLLPNELWTNPNTTFLDPCSKSGIFLREIVKRLNEGLKEQIPDDQERINHICTKQVFGIAITELTLQVTKRSVYCSKQADGKYSVCTAFNTPDGNIKFTEICHTWNSDGKCIYCGASREYFERPDDLEAHAYLFIHTKKIEDVFGMKFDVIIGNPPYQLETGGSGRQAKPIYQLFVNQAKKLNPTYLVMIIPSRWFAGGMGLEQFREEMLSDKRMRVIVDYSNAKDCFPSNSVSGGVNYFLWDKNYNGPCKVVNVSDRTTNETTRFLDEYPVLIRYNNALSIVRKVKKLSEPSIQRLVSSISPFGLKTSTRGDSEKQFDDDIVLYSSAGSSFIRKTDVDSKNELVDKFKVMISQTSAEHAGEPSKDGTFRVLSGSMRTLSPGEVCTHSYIVIGPMKSNKQCDNVLSYLKTKFVRFLILQALTSIHISKNTFLFVPEQDFDNEWNDEKLYTKYSLTNEEIEYIESTIKTMERDE